MSKHTEEIEALIVERCSVWQSRLGLDHWLIELVFLDTNHPDDTDDGQRTPAECKPSWAHLRATIDWYIPTIASYEDDYLDQLALHEMAHVLLASEQDCIKPSCAQQMELATEMVARALRKAYLP